MLDELFNKAASAMYCLKPNETQAHWKETIDGVKFQGLLIKLAAALEGDDEPVSLN